MVRLTDRPAMTIAVDLGRKATKQTKNKTHQASKPTLKCVCVKKKGNHLIYPKSPHPPGPIHPIVIYNYGLEFNQNLDMHISWGWLIGYIPFFQMIPYINFLKAQIMYLLAIL